MFDGWQRRRHRDLVESAAAMKAAMSDDAEAISKAFPEPESLFAGLQDDGWDRSRWW